MSGKLTVEAIKKTFLELLEEKPLSKITISDITTRVGVNRQTFYYHFSDVLDLTADIFRDVAVVCVGDDGDLSNCMMRFYDYFMAHRKAMLSIIKSEYQDEIVGRMGEEIARIIEQLVDCAVPGKTLKGKERELTLHYYSKVVLTFMISWLEDGMHADRLTFNRLADMIEMNLKNTVEVLSTDNLDSLSN